MKRPSVRSISAIVLFFLLISLPPCLAFPQAAQKDQAAPDLAELMAQRRLRKVQALTRFRHRAGLRHGGQELQMAYLKLDFHPMSVIHQCDENKQ